jgi:hypothetical protein
MNRDPRRDRRARRRRRDRFKRWQRRHYVSGPIVFESKDQLVRTVVGICAAVKSLDPRLSRAERYVAGNLTLLMFQPMIDKLGEQIADRLAKKSDGA